MVNGQGAVLTTAEAAVIVAGTQLIPFSIGIGASHSENGTAAMLRSALIQSPALEAFRGRNKAACFFNRTLTLFLTPYRIIFILLAMSGALPGAARSIEGRIALNFFIPNLPLRSLFVGLARAGFSHLFRPFAAAFFDRFTILLVVAICLAHTSLSAFLILGIALIALLTLIIRALTAPGRSAIGLLLRRREGIKRLFVVAFRACFHRNSIA